MAELNPAILPVRPGSISETDKLALSTIGIVVIEHEEPHTLRKPRLFTSAEAERLAKAEAKRARKAARRAHAKKGGA